MTKKLWPVRVAGIGTHIGAHLGVCIGLGLLAAQAVQAHGTAEPKHGGMVQTAGDLSFELVPQGDHASVYIDDHGKALPLAGASGKLTVLNGNEKAEAPLKVSGDKLEASGVKLAAGSKAVASVTTADKRTLTVRFSVK